MAKLGAYWPPPPSDMVILLLPSSTINLKPLGHGPRESHSTRPTASSMSPSVSVLVEMQGELTPSQLVTSKPGQGQPGQTTLAGSGQALLSDLACAWFCSPEIFWD